jgi:serine/threonine-protein kinase
LPDLRARLQQAYDGKFRIGRELTGGGMSRIFLAEDIQLERDVVIKVLSPHLVDDELIQRFRQEVLHTARLQHPTIVTLYDSGSITTADGRILPLYVMPYVRGESLRVRLQHEGSLSVNMSLRILRNVLDALAYAHAHGVVHRDIKPENIFLSGGNAVVADFGIAKAVAGPRQSPSITSPGMAVGTPSYMAPEQLTGANTADHRSDLYAVGVVAYEMLAGRLPWSGTTPTEMLASQARSTPASLRAIRGDVPAALDDGIRKCLTWEPSGRPQMAAELLRLVDAIGVTPVTPTAVSTGSVPMIRPSTRRAAKIAGGVVALIAVVALFVRSMTALPGFVRLAVLYPDLRGAAASSDTLKEQLYHGLIRNLSRIDRLQLRGEVTVSQLVEAGLGSKQIADSLAVLQFDSSLVVTAEPGADSSYLLSLELRQLRGGKTTPLAGPVALKSLQGLSGDSVTTLVRFLAAQAAFRLGLTAASARVTETQSVAAQMTWLRGQDAYANRTPEAVKKAIGLFESAANIDSTFAPAYADLAQALGLTLFYHYRTADNPMRTTVRALRYANRAAALQPTLAESYTALGYLGMIAGAPPASLHENYGKAQTLKPTNPYSQTWYVGLLFVDNKLDAALDALEEQARRDPLSPAPRISLALYSLPARQYLNTVRNAALAREMHSGVALTTGLELWARVLLGGRELAPCVSLNAGPYLGARALCLERTQHAAEARVVTDSLRRIALGQSAGDPQFDPSLYVAELAMYYAARGDSAEARQWLKDAYRASPIGIDPRVLRSGIFSDQLVALGDSLRADAWRRVREEAARPDSGGGAP